MGAVQPVAEDFLIRILRDKQVQIAERKLLMPPVLLRQMAQQQVPARRARLRAERLRVIAEIKRGSPSAGTFDAALDAPAMAERYVQGGAAAVSVLTDGPYFQGSLADLEAVRARVDAPLLRKDFIIDDYQLLEARAAGADIVLLIVAALHTDNLKGLYERAAELGMQALVEVNTVQEAETAIEIGADLVGINNRDLHTFRVDLGTTERLKPQFPPSTVIAALSGVRGVADAVRMRAAGVDAVLVGEALMRAADPAGLLAHLGALQ